MSKCNAFLGGIMLDERGIMDVCCGSQWPGNMCKHFPIEQYEQMQQYRLRAWENSKTKWQIGCQSCQLSEQIKDESSREKFNRIVDVAENPINTSIQQTTIRTGRTCNLKCTMCGPSLSSKWASFVDNNLNSEFIKKYKLSVDDEEVSQEKFVDFVKNKIINPDLKRIEFTGGEPLYSKATYKIVEYLLETGYYKKIEKIKLQTNGTTKFNDVMKDLFKRFNGSVEVSLSSDGTDEVFEYIRRDHSWDNFVDVTTSMKQFLDTTGLEYSLKISYMLQAINSKSFEKDREFYNNWDQLHDREPFHYDIVHDPKHLSLASIPLNLKKLWKCPVDDSLKYNQLQHKNMIEYYDVIDTKDNHPSWRNFIPELEL